MLLSNLSFAAFIGYAVALPWWDDHHDHHGPPKWHKGKHHSNDNDDCEPIGTLVDLGYTKYKGREVGDSVNQYLGMRYAAPPLGDLRFRAPEDPVANLTTQSAQEHGPICYGVGSSADTEGASEDCLFIDVFAPSNATEESNLPVFFWIQGGGYVQNSNADYNGTTLVETSGGNMIVVTFNYRVGAFGFLAGDEVAKGGNLNVGLLDQRLAIRWAKEHISKFGGDPEHIVLVGASAGAGSIAMHILAYGGNDRGLFVGAIGESVFFPTQPKCPELQWQYDAYVSAANCSNSTDTLSCLRSQHSSNLQAANTAFPYPGRTASPLFEYSPCVDGDLLTDYPSLLFQRGEFLDVPLIFGNDQDEGTSFAVNASVPANISSFFMDQFPDLTLANTTAIVDTYPLSDFPPRPEHALYFGDAAAAYGEAVFNCPGLLIARTANRYNRSPAYSYRYNVLDPANAAAGVGVTHTYEIPAVWGTDSDAGGTGDSAYQTLNAPVVPLVMEYWISFVRTLDPNTFRLEGAPEWETWGREGERLVFETGGTAEMETVPRGQRERCAFWEGLVEVLEQ